MRFSDVLAKDQKLQGLIDIGGRPLTFEIDGNVVRVYSTQEFLGGVRVSVQPSVRNYLARQLKDGTTGPSPSNRSGPRSASSAGGSSCPAKTG